jgi:hypothetical protein
MKSPLADPLLSVRIKLHLLRKRATTFSEETVINSIIYAVDNALDILNGKKSLLQGPKEETTNDKGRTI